MAIKIGTKKIIKDSTWFREIIKISGVAAQSQLPPEYLELNTYIFSIPSGILVRDDSNTSVLEIGDIISEGEFLVLMDVIKRAGNNLYRLNKGLPINENWKGRETFTI